jgi:hypothetical protein
LQAQHDSLFHVHAKAMQGRGEPIDPRGAFSVTVRTAVIDACDLGRTARTQVALQQVVSGIEAIWNAQRGWARRGVYLTEIHDTHYNAFRRQ